MSDNKENNPGSIGGPAADTSATKATGGLKMAKYAMHTEIRDALDYNAHDGLDDIVRGGCSTCGSLKHDTAKCDHKGAPSECVMSGAVQTDTGSSTCASASAVASSAATPAAKSGQAKVDTLLGQGAAGQRRSG